MPAALLACTLIAAGTACVFAVPTPVLGQPVRAGEAPREGHLPGWGGVRIHYRILGSGPDTVVAVHGGPGAGMQSILPELSPLGSTLTVIFYDQRGGGRSELPPDTTLLGAREHVQDLDAVRRFFGIERLSLVTFSFGAVLAARYAQEFPGRVERMVFFGAVGPDRDAAARQARSTPPLIGSAVGERFAAVFRALLEGSAPDPVAACREYEAIGRELAMARGESVLWQGTTCAMPPEAVRYYYRFTAQLSPRDFGAWDFTRSLRHVEAPLLVIAGGMDPAPLDLQRSWAAAVPNGRLLVIPGAGKTVSADRPDIFFPAVEEFLAGRWPVASEPVAPDRPGLTLEEVLDRNAAATGGRERLDTLRSVVTLRNSTSLTSLKLPHFVLVEGFDSTGVLNYAEGYDGRQAWEQTRRDSTRRVVVGRPAIALRRVVQWPGNVAPLYRMPELGHVLVLEGTEIIEETAYHRLRLTLSDGFERWYYVNAATFRIERARDTRELHADDGNVRHIETVFTDYREVGGYWFPYTVIERDVGTGDRLYARTMLAIFPNAEIVDDRFGPEGASSFSHVEAFLRLHHETMR